MATRCMFPYNLQQNYNVYFVSLLHDNP